MGWLDSNGLRKVWENIRAALAGKQDKLTGAAGQVVGFDAGGDPVAQSTADLIGPQGPKGDTGADGAKGDTGATGPKGDKGDPGLFYGTCSTAASTTAKAVTLSGFTLTAGAVVAVKFDNANTASSPTLNVNGTGAKYIKKYGTTAPDAYMWQAGEVVEFVYDGTYWIMVRGGIATTTYYGLTRLSSSVSSTSTGLAATPSAVKQAYDLASAALPKSGGTMTGPLSVSAPTEDAHAATKAYVDKWIYDLAAYLRPLSASSQYVTLSGAFTAMIEVTQNANSTPAYWFTYNGTFSANASGTLYLNPPPGHAFTGLANSYLPVLTCNNQNVPGTLDSSGRYQFTLSSGMAGKAFHFSNGAGSSNGFAWLAMELI